MPPRLVRDSLWSALRLLAALMAAAAIAVQARVTIGGAISDGRDLATTVTNFFSFFTILSNLGVVVVLTWAGVWLWRRRADAAVVESLRLGMSLAAVSTYMIVTGVVYNVLLRGIELPQGSTVAWSNEILHLVGPAILLADVLFAPRRRALPWQTIGLIMVFPLVWTAYTLMRGPLVVNTITGDPWWYPYPFLDPHLQGGYDGVGRYIVVIAVVIAATAGAVVWVSRLRGARRAARRQTTGSIAGSAHEPSDSAGRGR